MKKNVLAFVMSVVNILPTLAETNALIEVKTFKDWVIKGEYTFGGFAFKNTGTDPFSLAKKPLDFEMYQMMPSKSEDIRSLDGGLRRIEQRSDGFLCILPGETHVYEGRTFLLDTKHIFSEGEIRFVKPIYFGNGVWIDTKPVTFNGIVPDSEEHIATITDVNGSWNLVAVTYKNERWLYSKSTIYWSVCPLSLTNKIRVEPHDDKRLYKIWDGDKSMIYQDGTCMLLEGPDENDVFGKWTRERNRRPVRLHCNSRLQGHFVLSMTGTQEVVRLWRIPL